MGARFEDLLIWNKARELTRLVYDVSRDGAFGRDFALRDQVRSAGISVMSNIAEGYERGSDAEFCRFLRIARGSCGEVRSQLYVALDQKYLDQPTFDHLATIAVEASRMIRAMSHAARARNRR